MKASDSTAVAPHQLEDAILEALRTTVERTLSPPEIAQAIAGDNSWHNLLAPIRVSAVNLALTGRLIIYRKGRPVDPTSFRGVYRLGLPRHD